MSTPRHSIEIITFLIAPATVNVTNGSFNYTYTAPAGMNVQLYPANEGFVTATIVRGGSTVSTLTPPRRINDRPYMDDKQYFWFSSLRGTVGQERHPGVDAATINT